MAPPHTHSTIRRAGKRAYTRSTLFLASFVSISTILGATQTLTSFTVDNVGAGQATFVATASDAVTACFVVLEADQPQPDTAQIAAGTDQSGTTTRHGTIVLHPGVSARYTLSGLQSATDYVVYATALDSSAGVGDTSLRSTFTTDPVNNTLSLGWCPVGGANFSDGKAYNPVAAIAPDQTPYVAFIDSAHNNKASVMRFRPDAGWSVVGSAGFTTGKIASPDLKISPCGTLFIAFRDETNSGKATVMKHDPTSGWIPVGNEGFSAAGVNYPNLGFGPDGAPYLAFVDAGNGNRATVMRYDENTNLWSPLGAPAFSMGEIGPPNLTICSTGTPYLAYSDRANSSRATVMRYDDASGWAPVGSEAVSDNAVYYTSCATAPDGTIYLAYLEANLPLSTKVMHYTPGSGWIPVGAADLSGIVAYCPTLTVDPDGSPIIAFIDGNDSSYAATLRFNALGSTWTRMGRVGYSHKRNGPPHIVTGPSGDPWVVFGDYGHASLARLAPTITEVTPPPAGIYSTGDRLSFVAHYSAPVSVDIAGGTPELWLHVGYHDVPAVYNAAASSATALVFDYTIQRGDDDSDGIEFWNFGSTGLAIRSNGGRIFDPTGSDAGLAFTTAGPVSEIFVDTVAPFPPAITSGAGPTTNSTPVIAGTVEDGCTVEIWRDGELVDTVASVAGTWSYRAAGPQVDDIYTYTAYAVDSAGNISDSTTITVTIDTVAPAPLSLIKAEHAFAGQVSFSFASVEACAARFVVLPTGTVPPTPAQIAAGTDAADRLARHGALSLAAGRPGRYTLRNLAVGTEYTVFAVTSDEAGNCSTARTTKFTTPAHLRDLSALEWNPVGPPAFSGCAVAYSSLDVAEDGTPYVSFRDNNGTMKASVMRFDVSLNEWVFVGGQDLSQGVAASDTCVGIAPDGIPHLVYHDYYSDGSTISKVALLRFDKDNGTWSRLDDGGNLRLGAIYMSLAFAPDCSPCFAASNGNTASEASFTQCNAFTGIWTSVGEPGISEGTIASIALAFSPEGIPFVAYADGAHGYKATVMKYEPESGTWVSVGGAGISAGGAGALSIAIAPDGTPYVSYSDGTNSYRAKVLRYDRASNVWVSLGGIDFAGPMSGNSSLAIDAAGSPYIVCRDLDNPNISNVLRYSATNDCWLPITPTGFSGTQGGDTNVALTPDGTPFVSFVDGNRDYKMTVMTLTPAVTSVEVPDSGTYGTGAKLRFEVNYGSAVEIDTTNGSPTLPLQIGSRWLDAVYSAEESTETSLAFTYAVQPGDTDTDGISTAASLALNGGSIIDSATGLPTGLMLNQIGNTSNVIVVADIATYESWAAANFSAEDLADPVVSGADADPDGVGLNNLLRYAFDLPARGQVGQPIEVSFEHAATEPTLTLYFAVRAEGEGLSYEVQSSADLRNWTTQRSYTSDGSLRFEACSVPVQQGARRFFLRIKVSE